jgi:hypothetical protein
MWPQSTQHLHLEDSMSVNPKHCLLWCVSESQYQPETIEHSNNINQKQFKSIIHARSQWLYNQLDVQVLHCLAQQWLVWPHWQSHFAASTIWIYNAYKLKMFHNWDV